MARLSRYSTRSLLRAFQKVRSNATDPGLLDDLNLLQAKDLDMSVRLGVLLAFDALMIATAINPISASPGAPLSLDAPTQPLETVAVFIAVILLSISAIYCVRGILIGEEFAIDDVNDTPDITRQRMLAAWCRSVDVQLRSIRLGARLTAAGGALTLLTFIWILAEKIIR
jgi:hypothetical protein